MQVGPVRWRWSPDTTNRNADKTVVVGGLNASDRRPAARASVLLVRSPVVNHIGSKVRDGCVVVTQEVLWVGVLGFQCGVIGSDRFPWNTMRPARRERATVFWSDLGDHGADAGSVKSLHRAVCAELVARVTSIGQRRLLEQVPTLREALEPSCGARSAVGPSPGGPRANRPATTGGQGRCCRLGRVSLLRTRAAFLRRRCRTSHWRWSRCGSCRHGKPERCSPPPGHLPARPC